LDEFIKVLDTLLDKIGEGNASGVPYLKPEGADGETWRNEKTDDPDVWLKDVVYLKSCGIRIRTVWNFGSSYSIYVNNPKTSETIENFSGTKIRMNNIEISYLLDILREIRDKCPSYELMMDFSDRN